MKRKINTLSDSEYAFLIKERKRGYFIVALIILSIAFLLYILFLANEVTTINSFYFGITLLACLVFIIGLHVYLSKPLRKDIDEKTKYINQYIIEEKESYEDDEPGKGGYVIRYVLKSEGRKFFVDKNLYEKTAIGDIIEEHITQNKELFLGLSTSKSAST